MLLLLINASIIWLSSLLIYELLLKVETFHRLNRYYLLATFITGIVLPLLPLGQIVFVTSPDAPANGIPLTQASQALMLPATIHSNSYAAGSNADWWRILYAAGVAGSILYLFRDLLRLWVLYRGAIIRKEGRWIIAETGRPHSPFSFLHIVFVCSIDQYSHQQWRMVLQHEQQHYRSRHILDLALLHAASVVLWFHPAVYIYRNKLRMLHEYEADSLQQHDVFSYGSFLLEQAAFSPPPALAHSLTFSPLRERIQMMTKGRSRRFVQLRFLLLLPMMSMFIWCCNKKPKVAIDIKGRYAMLHDSRISYPKPTASDTLVLAGNGAGQEPSIVVMEPIPDNLGDQAIAKPEDLADAPKCIRPGTGFGIRYLLEEAELKPVLQKMNDGSYYMSISDIIVDRTGKVIYYNLTGPENDAEASLEPGGYYVAKPNGLKEADKEEIQKRLSAVLIGGSIAFAPAKNKQGTEVPYILESGSQKSGFELKTTITVKKHSFSFPDQAL